MKKRLILILTVLIFASLACSVFIGPVVSDDTPAPVLVPENIEEPAAAPVPEVVDKTIRTDDFSDTNSGWPESTTDDGRAYYEAGEYHIEVNSAKLDLWAHPKWNMPNDLSIEVDVPKSAAQMIMITASFAATMILTQARITISSSSVAMATLASVSRKARKQPSFQARAWKKLEKSSKAMR